MSTKKKQIEVGYGNVKKVSIGLENPLVFIGGPCAIESREHSFLMANKICIICDKLEIPWIFKSCYDKDCRSSPKSFHGVGIDEGLNILSDVRREFNVPVVSWPSNIDPVKPVPPLFPSVKSSIALTPEPLLPFAVQERVPLPSVFKT